MGTKTSIVKTVIFVVFLFMLAAIIPWLLAYYVGAWVCNLYYVPGFFVVIVYAFRNGFIEAKTSDKSD